MDNKRIEQYQKDIKCYQPAGMRLLGYTIKEIFVANQNISKMELHYAIKYFKAWMKLNAILDEIHTEGEKESRLLQIDEDCYHMEQFFNNLYKYRNKLLE